MSMIIQVASNRNGTKKYQGNVVVTDAMATEVSKTKSFNTKFELFCYGITSGWSKKSIMKYCLDTEREQYFHNYYTKYLASKQS